MDKNDLIVQLLYAHRAAVAQDEAAALAFLDVFEPNTLAQAFRRLPLARRIAVKEVLQNIPITSQSLPFSDGN